jgi:hypothetical protein
MTHGYWPPLVNGQGGKELLISSSTLRPQPASIWTIFSLKLTFLALLAGQSDGPAFFSGASAILLTHWVEVEGPVGRIGASGVGGMAAGDGLALGGFWPGNFLLLCAKNSHGSEQVKLYMI